MSTSIEQHSDLFFSLIQRRRSIRKYKTRPIEQDKIELLAQAALLAPSSRSTCPWEFIFVRDPKLLEELSAAKAHGSAFLAGAALAIVVCADARKCDVWVEDASIASTYLLLAAEALGLGACWIQIRKRKRADGTGADGYVRDALGIPETLCPESIIAVGYPDEKKAARRVQDLDYGKVFYNRYGAGK